MRFITIILSLICLVTGLNLQLGAESQLDFVEATQMITLGFVLIVVAELERYK